MTSRAGPEQGRRRAGHHSIANESITPIRISEVEYADLTENYGGICVECGDQAYGVGPDARRYRCDSCGANAVYGVEELLVCGNIQFTDEDCE